MSTYEMTVDGLTVHVARRKTRKLTVRVTRPEGKVKVRIPYGLPDKLAEDFVRSNMDKILESLKSMPCHTPLQFITGEHHHFAGKEYSLQVVELPAAPMVFCLDSRIIMRVRPGSDQAKRKSVMRGWYRSELLARAWGMVDTWAPRIGERPEEVCIKKMKNLWGSCNPVDRRIWLSEELAKKDPAQVEYVMVHEMVHLIVRGHPPRFYQLMDKFLPDWRSRKELLDGLRTDCDT